MKACKIYTLIAAVVLLSCSKTKEKGNNLRVTRCKDYALTSQVVNVCFNQVLSDSRCPKDVVCIWQGSAIIELSVLINTELHKIQLASNTTLPSLPSSDTTINRVKIEVLELTPYPCTNCPAPPVKETYKVKLKLSEV